MLSQPFAPPSYPYFKGRSIGRRFAFVEAKKQILFKNGTLTAVSPREFLEVVVLPNRRELHENCADLRRAYNAIASIDALAAHVYFWLTTNAPTTVTHLKSDSAYREELAGKDPNFRLLRDIAKAQKHVVLNRGNPQVTEASQLTSRPTGWGHGRFGQGRFGGPPQVVVEIGPGSFEYAETILDQALGLLIAEMDAAGI